MSQESSTKTTAAIAQHNVRVLAVTLQFFAPLSNVRNGSIADKADKSGYWATGAQFRRGASPQGIHQSGRNS